MNLTTPLMDARKIMSTTYVDALYLMFKDMAGSDTTLQDDTSGILYTPDGVFTRSNNTISINDTTAITLTAPAANKEIAVNEDVISICVAKIVDPTGHCHFNLGSGLTDGWMNRFAAEGVGTSGTSGPVVKDGTTQVRDEDHDTAGTPGSDEYILFSFAWDRSFGLYSYSYNLSTNTVLRDNSKAGVANLAVTPDNTTRISNLSDMLLGAVFTFPSGGLPSTWKSDILAMANAVLAEKG